MIKKLQLGYGTVVKEQTGRTYEALAPREVPLA